MVDEELERIEYNFQKGIILLRSGERGKVKRLIQSIEKSWAISESRRAITILRAYDLLLRGKRRRAASRCLQSLSYLWNSPEGLFVIRQTHTAPTATTRWFELLVNGEQIPLGLFSALTSEYLTRILVLADSEDEAASFVQEFCLPDWELKVEQFEEYNLNQDGWEIDQKGVYACSPFSSDSVPESFLGGDDVSNLQTLH